MVLNMPELRRLVRRIDNQIHVSRRVYDDMRVCIYLWLENVIRRALIFMDIDRLKPKRIRVSHVLAALKYEPGNY